MNGMGWKSEGTRAANCIESLLNEFWFLICDFVVALQLKLYLKLQEYSQKTYRLNAKYLETQKLYVTMTKKVCFASMYHALQSILAGLFARVPPCPWALHL